MTLPRQALSDKILFLRKLPKELRATSAVVGPLGFHWRSLADDAALAASLQTERFSLIVVDHRGVPGDPLALLSSLPGVRMGTPIFLISDLQLELEKVIQAIRLSVKDVFHPPLDLKLMVERLQAVLRPNAEPGGFEMWSEFVMFLADGEKILPAATKDGKGPGTPEASARLALLGMERDQLSAERLKLQQAAAETQARVDDLAAEAGRLRAENAKLKSAQENHESDRVLQAEVLKKSNGDAAASASSQAAEFEKLEAEQAALAQQRQKFKKESTAWQVTVEETKAALARRSQELEAIVAAHAEAASRLTAEHEEFEAAQLVAEQAQTRIDEVVVDLHAATEKLKLQRAQVAAEHRKTEAELAQRATTLAATEKAHAVERQKFEAVRAAFQAEQRVLADKASELEAAEVLGKAQAGKLKKAQEEVSVERVALEKQARMLAERQQQFEAKQQQVRDQMKQLLTANL